VLDGDRAPPNKKGSASPIFGPCLLWPNGRPSQLLLSSSPRDYELFAKIQRHHIGASHRGLTLNTPSLPVIYYACAIVFVNVNPDTKFEVPSFQSII